MNATIQSNFLISNQTSFLLSDNIRGSGQIHRVPDQKKEIGVISGVRKILVPVHQRASSNVDWNRYGDPELMVDEGAGVHQIWVEVVPPNQAVALPLNNGSAGEDQLNRDDDTVVYLDCIDFQSTYRELIRRGATFVVAPARMPFGWLSMFEDEDGRRYVLGQW